MSLPDPYLSHNIGVVSTALNLANEALAQAFAAALRDHDYDAPVVAAIRQAQDGVQAARSVELSWHAPALSRERRDG